MLWIHRKRLGFLFLPIHANPLPTTLNEALFSNGRTQDLAIGSGTPLQYSCLENPMDGGAWKAAVHGVAEGRTQLSDFPFTFHFHALEKAMATHSSVLAWRIPGTGEPGGLPSMGSHRVGHDWSDLAAAAVKQVLKYKFVWLCHLICDKGGKNIQWMIASSISGAEKTGQLHVSQFSQFSCSVVSESLWPYELQPWRLLCPCDFPHVSYIAGGLFTGEARKE